jgi:hypothetical protein
MPNRTISLDDVSDAIRKQLVKDGHNFSHWVRMQLRKHQPAENEVKVKPRVPPNYMCRNCLGNHWTVDCHLMPSNTERLDGHRWDGD